MHKSEVFCEELSWIKSATLRDFTEAAIDLLPDYFFQVAASSTGKYHPKYALGPGGLVRHTKAAVKIAHELLSIEMYGRYSEIEKDLILIALLLHDGWKHGKESGEQITSSSYTVADHPLVAAEWLKTLPHWDDTFTEEEQRILAGCIASHMGQWNTDYRSRREILPKPVTGIQKFVHQCDYLASRKWLTVEFEDYYTPEEESATEPLEAKPPCPPLIDEINALCKEKIAAGVRRSTVYDIITRHNSGNRNPNSITDPQVAEAILKELKPLEVPANE